MQITFENVTLRDMLETDIENYVRWFTKETDWMNYDTPWEQEETTEQQERISWTLYFQSVNNLDNTYFRNKFEIEFEGKHVGWVCSYFIDEKYNWISQKDIKDFSKVKLAVGIDIAESSYLNKKIGTRALKSFIDYCFENGWGEIYTQTWSGNLRMLRCAEKLGFKEINRYEGIREVKGEYFDALTFVYKE